MGMYSADAIVVEIQERLNWRFASANIGEIVDFQVRCEVFSPNKPLRVSFSQLGLMPTDEFHNKQLAKYIDSMKMMPSDLEGESAHVRLARALRDALENDPPVPIRFEQHAFDEDPRALCKVGIDGMQTFSVPAKSREQAKQDVRDAKAARIVERQSRT